MPFEWEEIQETTWAIFNLLMNMGLVASVIDQYPSHVQDNFKEKLAGIRDFAEREMEEIQTFGEAYDGENETS